MAEAPGDAVFGALSDPTRRHIIEQLGRHGPQTATGLSAELGITRQAVAKHLQLLAEAGLATSTRVGREARYAADFETLDAVSGWIDRVQGEWKRRLDLLAEGIERGRA